MEIRAAINQTDLRRGLPGVPNPSTVYGVNTEDLIGFLKTVFQNTVFWTINSFKDEKLKDTVQSGLFFLI